MPGRVALRLIQATAPECVAGPRVLHDRMAAESASDSGAIPDDRLFPVLGRAAILRALRYAQGSRKGCNRERGVKPRLPPQL